MQIDRVEWQQKQHSIQLDDIEQHVLMPVIAWTPTVWAAFFHAKNVEIPNVEHFVAATVMIFSFQFLPKEKHPK